MKPEAGTTHPGQIGRQAVNGARAAVLDHLAGGARIIWSSVWGIVSMPIYVYEFIMDDGLPGAKFEVRQKMSDPPLEVHPITRQAVRRVIQAPNLGGKYSEANMKKTLDDDKRIDSLGLTKYVRTGDGHYEKRAGQGPDEISPDGE